MYTIKVVRFRDGITAVAQGSSVQILKDHLAASTARHGFEVEPFDELSGDIFRNGAAVGEYEIYYGEG